MVGVFSVVTKRGVDEKRKVVHVAELMLVELREQKDVDKFTRNLRVNEHRFYGKSVPLGSIDATMMDLNAGGSLTSQQSLADFANIILKLMKYPQVVNGALASSAPVLGSVGLVPKNQYCSIVSRDFMVVNKKCYEYISRSRGMIDEVADHPNGLDKLSKTFNTCG
ncbi:uncharacterized protein LOC141595496 [Silene latifolia]|uniref:uncharacterized protein LOC141595496 n=1 Tax=Silene latifolia TaxID=37657 RepID=UPI003D780E03